MKKSSLRVGILFPVLSALILLGVTTTATLSWRAAEDMRKIFDDRIRQAAQVLERDAGERVARLQATIPWFERSGRAIQILNANDRLGAIEFGKLAMKSFGTDYFVLTKADGTVVARAHDPENFGDSIAQQVSIQAAMKKQSLVAVEEGKVVKLSIRGGVPVLDANDKLIGIVSTGFTLSQNTYVDSLQAILGTQVTVFEGNKRLVTTHRGADGNRLVGTTLNNPLIEKQVLADGKPYYGTSRIQGQSYTAAYLPMKNYKGTIVGMLFVGLPLQTVETTILNLTLVSTLIMLFITLVSSFLLVLYLQARVIRPLIKTTTDLSAMAKGQIPLMDPQRLKRRDEIGTMSRSLESLAAYLNNGGDIASQIADGNLNVYPRAAGEEDRFGQAFGRMATELNRLVSQILKSADEVVSGVGQIAEGTHSLSQGATESASSLEEMTTTLSTLVQTSEATTKETLAAATLSQAVNKSAGESQEEMQKLLQAMSAIEASAKDIQKVVKTIDDVAFQVNLLALNANIEAARAGKHGKSFSVVAEEVRSLSQRTAKAAHETNQMVVEALRRIEAGASTTRKTGQHLSQIAEAIGKVTEVLQAVAQRSVEQNTALNQLSGGMAQIGQTTESHVATAEESSSASQEIRNVAEELQKTASRFQLRNSQNEQEA